MNWNQIEGNWKEFSGQIKSQWGKLTDDDLTEAAGKRDKIVGAVQKRYGVAQQEAEKQVRKFEENVVTQGRA